MDLSISAVKSAFGSGISAVGGALVSAKVATVSLITQYVAARIFATVALLALAGGCGYKAYNHAVDLYDQCKNGRIKVAHVPAKAEEPEVKDTAGNVTKAHVPAVDEVAEVRGKANALKTLKNSKTLVAKLAAETIGAVFFAGSAVFVAVKL